MSAEDIDSEFHNIDDVVKIRELERRCAKLTIALNFWMPGVPVNDPDVATRASEDAGLLVQADLVCEKSAEELGWIRLRPEPQDGEHTQQK